MASLLRRALILAIWLGAATAQAVPPTVITTPPQPKWAELSVEQRTILSPLGNDWNSMEYFVRKKWLGIAARWPKMSAEEHTRAWDRMREWAKLKPEERRAARDRYRQLQKLSPPQREAMRRQWEAYSGLPDEERQKLKQAANPAKTTSHPTPGAKATAAAKPASSPAPAQTEPSTASAATLPVPTKP